jgi:hypothetical protein
LVAAPGIPKEGKALQAGGKVLHISRLGWTTVWIKNPLGIDPGDFDLRG